MMNDVHVRELAAWGVDRYRYRPAVDEQKIRDARTLVRTRPHYRIACPILVELTAEHQSSLNSHASRPDLLAEVVGLEWSLAIVDISRLLAFQRRLVLNPAAPTPVIPAANDWEALINFALAPPKPTPYTLQSEGSAAIITTSDPNLHLRLTADRAAPFIAHAGSPFFEVARYHDRWFLRDGYHRAYSLMQSHICAVPALVIEAKSLADLGAGQPQFFSEFLDPSLTLDYKRPALTKTIRVTIKENFAPASISGDTP
jgi:hypothetical protein